MQVAVLIKSNPQESHRPAEAVRIALGLISGQHEVKIILLGKAALLLSDEAEDLADGEELGKYLPTLKELDQTFYVEQTALKEAREEAGMEDCDCRIKAVSMEEISKLLSEAERHLIF